MNLNIIHLYHDFMNLYGESGNLRVLCRHLREQGFTTQIQQTSLGDKPDFAHADFIYMGCGTERNAILALGDLMQHREAFGEALERKVTTLLTGNAFHLLGEDITDAKGICREGLGVFPFHTVESDKQRYTNDALAKCPLFEEPVVGFVNKCTQISGITFPMFEMEMGEGNAAGDRREGIHFTSLYGTQLSGPLLVKNPALTRHFVKEIGQKKEGYAYRAVSFPFENKAYELTVKALRDRLASGEGEQVHR